jgi:hypothetical protein
MVDKKRKRKNTIKTKPPHYIIFKMEVEDKTYVIKMQVATKKIISYFFVLLSNFVNYITKYISH